VPASLPEHNRSESVAKIGRNQPCPCGSGSKAKRCCGVPRGPAPDQLAIAFLHAQTREWAPLLVGYNDHDLDELMHEVAELPASDLSLHATLPRLLPPALQQLRTAIAERDPDAAANAMPDALAIVDTPLERERLTRAIIALHDNGHHIDCETTAYAICELADPDITPALLFGGLLQALALTTGDHTTPAGLLVAAR
jgi:hypothetical protein